MDIKGIQEYLPTRIKPSNQQPASPIGPGRTSPQKRRRRTSEASHAAPPLKRQKGSFNPGYLTLLNEDIADAAAASVKEEPAHDLAPTQVGAVSWSAAEKHAFFTALGRLGRDDVAGVAARVASKTPLEVRQYVCLLDAAERARRADDGKRRRALRPVDVPAAAELSTELCAALEQAADSLALRCEAHEAAVEQKRWAGRWLVTGELARVLDRRAVEGLRRGGGDGGEVTATITTTTTTDASVGADVLPPFAELFVLRNWQRLSERVFMNSSVVPDGNWRGVSEEPPAIRATALADFHALVLSVVRRLVSAALWVAGSRVRAKRAGDRRNRTSTVVKTKDVQAAVASVGMPANSRGFWAKAARRLRLDVYDEQRDDDDDEEVVAEDDDDEGAGLSEGEDSDAYTAAEDDGDEYDDYNDDDNSHVSSDIEAEAQDSPNYDPPIMTYDEVETALGFPPTTHPFQSQTDRPSTPSPSISSDSFSDSFSDIDDPTYNPNADHPDIPMEDPPRSPASSEEEETEAEEDSASIVLDLHEALTYSAPTHLSHDLGTARGRDALRARIRAEHTLWADAEQHDEQAGAREEARLWGLLRDRGVRAAAKKDDDSEEEKDKDGVLGATPEGRKSGLVDLDPDWRDYVEYYSEWEVVGRIGGSRGTKLGD